jgi:hypothetical protein
VTDQVTGASLTCWLLRAAIVKLSSDDADYDIEMSVDEVHVLGSQRLRLNGQPAGRLFVAATNVELRLRNGELRSFPVEARRRTEAGLETVVRLMAIDWQCRYSIQSPMPYVGFLPITETRLDELSGVAAKLAITKGHTNVVGAYGLLSDVDASMLLDRLDGVALLAEAYNASSALGQYLQLIRLFERAFRLGPTDLTEPLACFLRASRFRFRRQEVIAWTQARAPSFHADRREVFYVDADVVPYVRRMLLAAQDVLLNKEKWRNRSYGRRRAWTPITGTSNAQNDAFVTQGTTGRLEISFVDGFGSYPVLLAGPIEPNLPRAAWLYPAENNRSELRVAGDARLQSRSERTQPGTGD